MNGIACPVCRSQNLAVIETRSGPDRIIRRRRCEKGHTFKSEEIVVHARHKRHVIFEKAKNFFESGGTIQGAMERFGISRAMAYRIKRGDNVKREYHEVERPRRKELPEPVKLPRGKRTPKLFQPPELHPIQTVWHKKTSAED